MFSWVVNIFYSEWCDKQNGLSKTYFLYNLGRTMQNNKQPIKIRRLKWPLKCTASMFWSNIYWYSSKSDSKSETICCHGYYMFSRCFLFIQCNYLLIEISKKCRQDFKLHIFTSYPVFNVFPSFSTLQLLFSTSF